jgi:hypothetical protein
MTSRSPEASHAFHSALPLLLAAVLGLLSGCSGRHSAAPAAARAAPSSSSPSQSAHRANPELTAEIGFNHAQSLFRVENRDTFAWSNCQFILNAHGTTTPGYTLALASVSPGLKETAMLQSGAFTDAAGKKFDPAVERIATLDFGCDTPRGRLRGQQFLLGEPPGQGKPQ